MEHSRRAFIRLGGGIAVSTLTGLAGCSSDVNPLGGGGSSTALNSIPADVSYAGRGDVTRTLNDSAVTQFANAIFDDFAENEYYEGPTSKSEFLTEFSDNAGISLSDANTAVGFGKYETEDDTSSSYTGLWFDADWSTDEVVDALESNDYALSESSYNGQPVYAPEREYQTMWLGSTGDTTYVLGSEMAVKETIDVSNGDMDSVGSGLKGAFSGVRNAPFKFAAVVPQSRLPEDEFDVENSSVDPQRFTDVNYVAGATYHESDTAGITVRLSTGGSDDAESVSEALEGAFAALAEATEDETFRSALNDVSVSTNGSTVVVKVSGSVERATEVITTVVSIFVGTA